MVAPSCPIRFVRPADVPAARSFVERLGGFADTVLAWHQQFSEADRRATARGLQLPAALYYHWLLFAVRHLFDYSDRHFTTPADLRALARIIHGLNIPSGTSSNIGTMVDVAPETLTFFTFGAPIPRPEWRPPTVPHIRDLKPLMPLEAFLDGGACDVLSVDAFLDRAAFLLSPKSDRDADWEWLEQVFFADGDGDAGTGGPYLMDAYKYANKRERDPDHPAGGVRNPYPEPGATRWLLDHPQLPPWRHLVVENVTSAARHLALTRGGPPLPEIPRGLPFSGLADLLLRHAMFIEGMTDGEERAQQGAADGTTASKQLPENPSEGSGATEGEATPASENELRPYRLEALELIYLLDTSHQPLPLTTGECAVMALLIRAGERGVRFAALTEPPPNYSRYVSSIKSRLKKAGIPDHIATPGNSGKRRGGTYAIRIQPS